MKVEVAESPAVPTAGTEVAFTVTVTDPDATIYESCTGASFGDGTHDGGCSIIMDTCPPNDDKAVDPPPRRADRFETTFRHVYANAGTYTASFSFQSSSGSCPDPYGSTGQGKVTVTVL